MVVPYALSSAVPSDINRDTSSMWPPSSHSSRAVQSYGEQQVQAAPRGPWKSSPLTAVLDHERLSAPDAAPLQLPQQPLAVVAGRAQREQFLRLLQDAERSHRETLQRALHAEMQVEQLRQLFQQWQVGIDTQRQQQLQVQKQMQALHVSLNQQEVRFAEQFRGLGLSIGSLLTAQQQDTRCKLEDMFSMQRKDVQYQLQDVFSMQEAQAFNQQRQLGELQLKVFKLERNQRAERRRQLTIRRPPPAAVCPAELRASPSPPRRQVICSEPNCCCPCDFPETCPFNPCFPVSISSEEDVPENPCLSNSDCFLRSIRLGLVEPPSCSGCDSPKRSLRTRVIKTWQHPESDAGYIADDEASLFSDAPSRNSSSFQEERRQLIQEVRSLENTRIAPRYKQIWKPLRCFQCGSTDHLATFCGMQTTTVL